ncbi:MAG: sulfatase [bacterium]|nr:sulfatase [bacterium]
MSSHLGPCRLLVACALLSLCACGSRVAAGAGEGGDVVLILVDSLRLDQVGCYGTGSSSTPAIDSLAAESVVYVQASAQAPWSMPSLASLLASRYPARLEHEHWPDRIPAEPPLLSETLRAAGYRTEAVVSHAFVGASHGFDRGFEQFVEIASDSGPTADGVTAAALELIDDGDERPRFLLVHYSDPRPPWHVDADVGDAQVETGIALKELLRIKDDLPPAGRATIRRQYAEAVRTTDLAIGELLDGMRARGAYDRSLIVLAGTNGFELFDHGDLGAGKTLFDELIRVPLIARFPELGAGTIDDPVGLIDLAPTILRYLDVVVDTSPEGISILPGAPRVERVLFAETSRARRLRAVMQGGWKLVEDLEAGTRELYDRRSDPRERTDLEGAEEARAQALAEWLVRFRTTPAAR